MLSTATTDPQQLLDYIHAFPIQNAPPGALTQSQVVSCIDAALALSACFLEPVAGPVSPLSWNEVQRNIQKEALQFICLVVNKIDSVFSSPLQFELVVLPRILRLLYSLEPWHSLELSADVSITPDVLRAIALDTAVQLLLRMGEDLMNRDEKTQRGWQMLRDIVSRHLHILQELRTMPVSAFPVVVNVVKEPYITDAAMGSGDPFKSAQPEDGPAITLDNQSHLLSFATIVLLMLSRTLHPQFAARCFMQAQTRTLLDILGQYAPAILSAPMNARTIPSYCRLADSMRVLCTPDFPVYYLQQHLSHFLAARLKEGPAVTLLQLDQRLIGLFEVSRMQISNTILDSLRQEAWVMELTPEAGSLRDVLYAAFLSWSRNLDRHRLGNLRAAIEPLPTSPRRDSLLSALEQLIQADQAAVAHGEQVMDLQITLKKTLVSMGVETVANYPVLTACLGAVASVAARRNIDQAAFLKGLAELPRLFSMEDSMQLSVLAEYLNIMRALQPVEDGTASRLVYVALGQAIAYDSEPYDPAVMKQCEALIRHGLTHAERDVRFAAGDAIVKIIKRYGDGTVPAVDVRTLCGPLDVAINDKRHCVRESAIVTFGLAGRLSNEVALLISLRALILQLGHKNILIRGLAHLQLRSMAAHHKKSFYSLVSPFMPEIARLVVSKLTQAPSTLIEFCRIASTTPTDFIAQTLHHTLPELVHERDADTLARISQELNRGVATLLLNDSHLPGILTRTFLSTNSEVVLEFILAQLTKDAHDGAKVSGEALVRTCILQLVCELVCCLGDTDQLEGRDAILALEKVQRKLAQASSSRRTPPLATFLEPYLLGTITFINDLLHDVRGRKAAGEKNKMLHSLGSFFALIGPRICQVSHQAMATLQSTIKIPALSDASAGAWFKFATALAPRDLGPCIGTLSAALVSSWPRLSSAARITSQRTLEHCIVVNRAHIKGHIDKVVDLSGISTLSGPAQTLADLRRNWTQQKYLVSLLQRCTGENITVTMQSLLELQRYIAQDSQQFLRAVASGDVFDPLVGRIVDVLLAAAATDGEDAEAVHLIAYEVLGALGAVDPDRFDHKSREKSFSMLQNFEDDKESLDFALHLLEELLVPAFRSTSDPRFQANVGYALQELSAFCGFTADLDKPESRSVKPSTRKLWESLSQTARDTITPFRGAKFKALEKDRPVVPLPIYPSQSSYRDWLQTWALHLVSRISSPYAKTLFSACRPAMRGNDARVALHLLPHVVLHVLISGSDEDRSAMCAEIVVVLEDLVTPDPSFSQDRRTFSAQTIFTLLDHLNTWVRHARQHNAKSEGRDRRKKNTSHLVAALEMRIVSVQSILSSIDQDLMARAAFECRAYARALMSLEQQVAEGHESADGALRERFERMHEIYSLVDEPDGMEGISTMIISPSMEMQIRQHESTGRWTAAQSCWEVKLQRSPNELSFHVGLLRCLRNLGHYDTLRTHIQGVLTRNPEWTDDLARFEVESAWMVGDWGHVQTVLQRPQVQTAESTIAQLLLSLRSQDATAVRDSFVIARLHLGAPITTAGRGSYRRSYDAVMNLHVVQELDLIHNSFRGDRVYDPLGSAVQELDRRFDSVLPTFRTRESLLSMRRTAFGLCMADHVTRGFDAASLNQAVGQTWLDTAKSARKAGHYQTAYSALLQASENRATFTYIQACKLTKDNGDALKALHDLTAELSKVKGATGEGKLDAATEALPQHEKRRLAKAMVLRARWMQETARFSHNDVSKQFGTAIQLCKEWESAYFHYGYYQDEMQRLITSEPEKLKGAAANLNFQTVQNYALSLQYGSKYIYQTMPRMLTLWLDLGEERAILLADGEGRVLTSKSAYFELQQVHFRMNSAVKAACAKIAVYKWLTAFPQLVSRVEHGNNTVRSILLGIVVRVISAYPQQGLWSFISVRQSKNSARMKRGQEVLSQLQALGDTSLTELVNTFVSMSHELLVLCNFTCGDTTPLSMNTNFPSLLRLTTKPTKLILPFQDSMTATMPPRNAENSEHQPFPLDLPLIHGFKDEVEIMKSLQKPRKITIIASDGEQYMMMAKPKDDLRKDARLMDFNTIINKLLKTNSDSRRRQLHIRTYSVVTLNEECGLLQWVPNTTPIRPVLYKSYQARSIEAWGAKVGVFFPRLKEADPPAAGKIFVQELLPMFPPVFHEWFLDMFPDPSAWLASRMAFSRTAAVMSIVGAMLGLGDRHSENILLDILTGDVVHVDFNCLFERGKLLDIPERVPFRLTQNIVDGLGVTGVEGVFRIACEIVMKLLRDYKDCLMNVLEAFIHDPLVEWVEEKHRKERQAHRSARNGQKIEKPPDIKAIGMHALQLISRKLSGMQAPEDFKNDRVISPSDQVAHLISEAMSPQNLGKMYSGWAAWL